MSLPLEKSSLRTALLQRRELLSRVAVDAGSRAAQAQLLGLPAFQDAKTLALYSPIRNEVETGRLLQVALATGKQVCYPRVFEDELRFFVVQAPEELRVGCFGICEPDRQSIEIALDQIDLLLVPGVAFDRHGHRLGYGRGYFDRLLIKSSFRGMSVGFGYAFQVQKKLPAEEHDQRLDLLVTDTKIFSPF